MMETVTTNSLHNNISNNFCTTTNNSELPYYEEEGPKRLPRARKTALDQHSNRKLFDINGNRAIFRRMSNFTLPEDVCRDANENIGESVGRRTSGEWENCLIEQIQDLLSIDKESLAKSIKVDICANQNEPLVEAHRRRKSSIRNPCLANKPHGSDININQEGRRPSVTKKDVTFTTARRVSNAGLGNTRIGKGRRSSVASGQVLGPLISTRIGPTVVGNRRGSSASIDNSRVMNPGRRYSVAQLNGLNPQIRRTSRCGDALIGAFPRQRRKSSAKPLSFQVPTVKISSSQKRLQYRQMRRKDRARINVAEIRRAISDVNDYELIDDGDDDAKDESDHERDVSNDITEEPGAESNDAETQENEDVEDDAVDARSDRRRTSIQVRAWELSRRLRQRRREKIKSCNM